MFFMLSLAPLALGGLSTLRGLLDFAPTRLKGLILNNSNNIREYLLLLSYFSSPSLDPTPIEPNNILDLSIANGNTPISTK